jgi:uncharacterized protein (TIGR02118 family)
MASDTKKAKADPAPKTEAVATDKTSSAEPAAKKTEAAPTDKNPAAEPAAKAAGSETATGAPSTYSRGEGQKPVTAAYKENWNAIFAKNKAKKKNAIVEENKMARMVVIYKTPADVAAFDKHYYEIHVPLAKKLPGLRKYEVSRGPIATPAGASGIHLIATLHFDDLAAIKKAFASPEGQAAGADRRIFAPDDSRLQMLLFENRDL